MQSPVTAKIKDKNSNGAVGNKYRDVIVRPLNTRGDVENFKYGCKKRQ